MDIVVTTLVVQLPQETTKVVTTNKIANVEIIILSTIIFSIYAPYKSHKFMFPRANIFK